MASKAGTNWALTTDTATAIFQPYIRERRTMFWKRLKCVFFGLLSVLALLTSVVAIEAGTGRIGGELRAIIWSTTDNWETCKN